MKRLNLMALGVFGLLVFGVLRFRRETTERIQSSALTVFGAAHEVVHGLASNPEVIDGVDISPAALAEKYSEDELAEKYGRLLREVGELRRIRSQFDAIQEENGRLRLALDFKENYVFRDQMVAARVIKRDASTFWNTMDIDKGADDGIVGDSPVLSYSGSLVGKVIRVAPGSATVLLLTDEQCQVAVKVAGTLERGILMGTRTSIGQETPELYLKFLSKNAVFDFESPAGPPFVITAGVPADDGESELGVFPSGLDVGTVTKFVTRELYGEALIAPAVDFSSITDVFVVLRRTVDTDSSIPAARVPGAEPALPAAVPVEELPGADETLDDIPTARPVNPPRAEPVEPPNP